MKSATTLQITEQDGGQVPNPTLSPLALTDPTADPNADPARHRITWSGPWLTDGVNASSYLKRGDYKVLVKGVRSDLLGQG